MNNKFLIVLFLILNIAFSQTSTPDTSQMSISERTRIIDIPYPLLFGFPIFSFGIIQNSGKNELQFGAYFYGEEKENYNEFGGWSTYRIYKNGDGKGTFYGIGLGASFNVWDYEGQSEPVTAILLLPHAYIGYRWVWDNGFTIAPFIGPSWEIGKVEASDGTIKEWSDGSKSDGGLEPALGISLAYMF